MFEVTQQYNNNWRIYGISIVTFPAILIYITLSIFTLSLPTTQANVYPADYGFNWLTVSDINNEAFPRHRATGAFKGAGSVSYEYRIARTELTVSQYLEFIEAYWPYYTDGSLYSESLTGAFIWSEKDNNNNYYFGIIEGWENAPTTMNLRMAARYCNWLHNGKVNEEWAFLNGVYDATTFGEDDEGNYTDVYERQSGAKYWIPNTDEWLKATYYDPNRYGSEEGGWWTYPNGADDPLIAALPEDGGETNAELWLWYDGPFLDVEMYPDVQSPWGLLDPSGGMAEITEKYAFGSSFFDPDGSARSSDVAGQSRSILTWHPMRPGYYDLRIATSIPEPTMHLVLIYILMLYFNYYRISRIC